jgi:RNA polymerase sigma-70 factor (ECF subfamily)
MSHERALLVRAPGGEATREESPDALFQTSLAANVASAYRLAAVILGNAADAEDATQDALERAWRARRSLRDPDRFEAWFQRILVNSCRDRVRRRRASPAIVSIDEGHEHGGASRVLQTPDPLQDMAARDGIGRAFARLNVDQRTVVAMRFYLDLEIDEITRRLGVRQGTVKSRLHRALKALRESWEAER